MAKKKAPPNQATQLLQLFDKHFWMTRDEDNNVWAVPKTGPNIALLFAHVSRALAELFHKDNGKPPSSNAIGEAKRTLEARIPHLGATRVPLRYQRAEDDPFTLYIDMGNVKGEAIKVSPLGWQVVARPPGPFRRTEATEEMFDPRDAEDGSVDGLRGIFNINDAAWDFLVGWLVTAFIPGFPHICLILVGKQGSAKTTLAGYLCELVDPSRAALAGCPQGVDDLIAHARGSVVIGLENIWHIPSAISDTLSRLVTGEAIRKRKLYTDADVHVTKMQRTIIINGIEVTGIKLDLRDRSINITLRPIHEDDRKLQEQCDRVFAENGAAAVRYLLDTLAATLKVAKRASHQMRKRARQADAQQWLRYVDAVRGTDAAESYGANAQANAREDAEDNPLTMALLTLLRSPEWEDGLDMPSREWVAQIPVRPVGVRPDEWPSTPKAFTGVMRMLEPGLTAGGWDIEEHLKDHSTWWYVRAPELDGGD